MSDEQLISRGELTAYLFTVADIRTDLAAIRRLLEGEGDGWEAEEEP